MERIGVLVRNGVVVNRIVWADHTEEQLSDDGYEHIEETTNFDDPPGIGWLWDITHGYRRPKPEPSWVWTGQIWEPPLPYPTDGKQYLWDEPTISWVEIQAVNP